MKVYLVQGFNDPCSYVIGIFADEQSAIEVAEIESKYHEFGCSVCELELLQSKQHWIEEAQERLEKD